MNLQEWLEELWKLLGGGDNPQETDNDNDGDRMKEYVIATMDDEEIVIDAPDLSTAYEIADEMGLEIYFIEEM